MKEMKQFKEYFEPKYQAYLLDKVVRQGELADHFQQMFDHLILVAQGGKRVRPFIVALAYESAGGTDRDSLLHMLYAIELYHLFALIHDDIIDRSAERHDVPCLHTVFGESQAILLGDIVLAWAFEAVSNPTVPAAARAIFLKLSQDTVIGQMVDTALVDLTPTRALVDQAIDYKTALYTFVYPIQIGLAYANAGDEVSSYTDMGYHLGRAFQRLDNASDIMADEAALGKLPCADVAQGTPTHLSLYIEAHGSEEDRSELSRYWKQSLSAEDRLIVRDIFVRSGAMAHEKDAIRHELAQARELIDTMSCTGTTRDTWLGYISAFEQKTDLLLQ